MAVLKFDRFRLVIVLPKKHEDSMNSAEETIQEIFNVYGVRIVTELERTGLGIACLPADEKICQQYLQNILAKELSIYPPSVIKKSKLNEVILCRDLVSGGERRGGLTCAAWLGSLGLSFARNKIYLNIGLAGNKLYKQGVVHHELFHMIDYFDDFNGLFDNQWKSLNRPGFVYHKDRINTAKATPQSGFISEYAMDAAWEDKAEVFTHLIVDYKGTERLALTDRILRAKVLRMKELLRSFSREFNDDFWRNRASDSRKFARKIGRPRQRRY